MKPLAILFGALALLGLTGIAHAAVPTSIVPTVCNIVGSTFNICIHDGTQPVPFAVTDSAAHTTSILSSVIPFGTTAGTAAAGNDARIGISPAAYLGGACASDSTDTCSIQAAITAACASALKVSLTKTSYSINATLTVPSNCNGIGIAGQSFRGTQIVSSALGSPILSVAGLGHDISNLSLDYTAAPSGASAVTWTASSSSLRKLYINQADTGLEVSNGAANFFDSLVISNYKSVGMYIHDTNDQFVSNFIFNAGNSTNGATGGIRLVNKAEAITFLNGDVLNGVYSLTTDAGADTVGARPAYDNFTQVFFDSSVNGSLLSKLHETDFVGSWFSAGRAGAGAPGVTVSSGDRIGFTNTRFFNSGSVGIDIQPGAKRVAIIGGSATGNSITTGSGVSCGINVEANVTDFTIQGVSANSDPAFGTQARGICVQTGTSDRYIITGNLIHNNVATTVLDGGSGANKLVQGNF